MDTKIILEETVGLGGYRYCGKLKIPDYPFAKLKGTIRINKLEQGFKKFMIEGSLTIDESVIPPYPLIECENETPVPTSREPVTIKLEHLNFSIDTKVDYIKETIGGNVYRL